MAITALAAGDGVRLPQLGSWTTVIFESLCGLAFLSTSFVLINFIDG